MKILGLFSVTFLKIKSICTQSSASSVRSFFEILLITAAMLNLETAWGAISNYTFDEFVNYTNPLQVFGGLAIGQVAGLLFFRRCSFHQKILLTIGLLVAAWVGIIYLPMLNMLWFSLPFAGFGLLLVDLFSREPLLRLLVASGLVGIVYFGIFLTITGLSFETLIGISVSLLCITLVVRSRYLPAVGYLIGLTLFWMVLAFGVLKIPSFYERTFPSFHGAQYLTDPEINLLFRTDFVYLPAVDKNLLVMNGSRFMILPSAQFVSKKMKDPSLFPSPTHDMPYQMGAPIRDVLVIGPAEGQNVLSALAYKAEHVTAVDINPAVFHFLKDKNPQLIGGIYTDPRVETVRMEGRHYLEITNKTYDLITLQGVQTGTPTQSGSTALIESFLFDKESLAVLWQRLNPNGVLFFDEYALDQYGDRNMSVIQNLARIARDTLPISDPNRQIFLFQYTQEPDNPKSTDEKRYARIGLIVMKTPMVGDVAARLEDVGSRFRSDFQNVGDGPALQISDNRPFYVREQGLGTPALLTIVVYLIVLVLGFFALWRFRMEKKTVSSRLSIALFVLGASYILLMMSFWGPLTLLIGEPFTVGPLVYFTLYLFALIGGILALSMRHLRIRWYFIIGVLGIAAAWFLVIALKPYILEFHNPLYPYLIGFAAIGTLALCLEIPYVVALRSVDGVERGALYAYENLGTLLGAGLSLIVQPLFGFAGSFTLGVVFVVIGAYLFYSARSSLAIS